MPPRKKTTRTRRTSSRGAGGNVQKEMAQLANLDQRLGKAVMKVGPEDQGRIQQAFSNLKSTRFEDLPSDVQSLVKKTERSGSSRSRPGGRRRGKK